jgi:CspA family cold shock protein
MVKGTMTWLSSTEEFGFVAPEDGGRDVFVRFPYRPESGRTAGDEGLGPLAQRATGREGQRGEGIDRYALKSSVEVRTRYQRGHWAGGYEIAGIVQSGYHVRRPGSLDVLPSIFVPADVRRSGDGR